MFAGAWIAPDMIWLSRLPTEPSSAAGDADVVRTAADVARAEARPQPRGPRLAARCPPKRSITFVGVAATEYEMVRCAYESLVPPASSCVYSDTPVIVPPYIVST